MKRKKSKEKTLQRNDFDSDFDCERQSDSDFDLDQSKKMVFGLDFH